MKLEGGEGELSDARASEKDYLSDPSQVGTSL
jgi:hypothetical protein